MFERFNDQARAVVRSARQEAAGLRHPFIGTEHLLLGLLVEPDGGAGSVLRAAGLSADQVRTEIQRLIDAGSAAFGAADADALRTVGIDLDAVRAKVEESFGPGALDLPPLSCRSGRSAGFTGAPFSPRAKKVLELSLREAVRLRHNYIGPEHILLGLIREGRGSAAQVLVALGASLDDLRQRVLLALGKAA